MKINLEDLRREAGDKSLSERAVILLQATRELRRVTEAMEETAENLVRPLLSLPPLGALTLVLIRWFSILRNLQVDNLEQETSPGHETLRALLVRAEMKDDARRVSLQDEVEKGRNLLVGTSRRVRESLGGDGHKRREEGLYKLRENIVVLAEPVQKIRMRANERPKGA